MPYDPNAYPDLSRDFPNSVPDLKINRDLNHPPPIGPHHDIIQSIPGGIEKVRIDPFGNPLGGETQIGPIKMPW